MKAALIFVVLASATEAAVERNTATANPIRKVVTMLQMMQKKVMNEAEKETQLYEKYMCWCKTSGGDLSKSIGDAENKIGELGAAIEEAEAQLKKLEEDVEAHKADRAAAKATIAEATAIREKEAAAFAKETAENKANLDALERAIAAISKGMTGGFLQTNASIVLRRLVLAKRDMDEDNRMELMAFLSAPAYGNEYVPQSGEILGILKQLHDEMAKDLADAIAAEDAAIAAYKELMAAKEKEIAALTKMIEEKLTRIAELKVEIATMKNDLTDTEEGLIEDKKFLADLEKNCATKEKEWAEICKMRQLELVALADTIKILNDDDALELFKKTLPSSLLQVQVTTETMRARALSIVQLARRNSESRPQLDFIALTLGGKKIGFEKVIKLIDEMVENLKEEQIADNKKKEYCTTSLDTADDKKKALENTIAGLETAIEKSKDAIAALKDEVEALDDAIKALDKAVAEATEQRKEENEDYTELMAQDSAAKEVILFAKNRLNKFYNPKLYTAPPKRELTEDERITVNNGGTLAPTAPPAGIAGTGIAVLSQTSTHDEHKDAPAPPPESFKAYAKKTEENNGVMAMMDMLVKDLDKEMTVATATEKDAQADYEKFLKESADKRAEDTKSVVDKEAAIAKLSGLMESDIEAKVAGEKDLAATLELISSLHAECDWLLKYFNIRKDARASEIDALGKAKAVLSGADFSFLQVGKTRGMLKRH